jgi:DNA-directed RNA polymerase specialized sigma24 family protein
MRAELSENAGSLDDALSAFVNVRRRLFGIAYRILASAAEAEDIVQDSPCALLRRRVERSIAHPGRQPAHRGDAFRGLA